MGVFKVVFDELDVTLDNDEKGTWKLLSPFTYYMDGEYVRVPAGYVTDFATVPRILWGLVSPWGEYGRASVVHDYLCSDKKVTNTKTQEIRICTRKEADKIFLEAMKDLNVNVVVCYAMYFSVRVFAIIRNKK